ncbi:TetR/AcrR family transcriptional regulator [Actinomycetes bacterium M1A6_2h]
MRTTAGRSVGKADDILQVFTHHVAQFGYDGTNFSDIATELSISKGTIVHHYGTKARLLATLHESYMRRRLAEATLIVETLPTPREQLAGLLFAFVQYQVHDRDATVAFQREIMRLPTLDPNTEGIALRAEYLELVRGVINAGVSRGDFRDTDVAVVSLLVFGSSQWAYTWYDPTGPERIEEIGAALVDLVLGSLLQRRTGLDKLADPDGKTVHTVKRCLDESSDYRGFAP